MKTKTFEIRDASTFIPVIATKMEPACEADRYLFARSGFGVEAANQAAYVFLACIDGGDGRATSDPYMWPGGARTMPTAHQYIIDHFDELESGAVVDVEFIMGLTPAPKVSEAAS